MDNNWQSEVNKGLPCLIRLPGLLEHPGRDGDNVTLWITFRSEGRDPTNRIHYSIQEIQLVKKRTDKAFTDRNSPLLDRREFMELSAAASAALMFSRAEATAEPASRLANRARVAPYRALSSLPPGEVRPEGWLRLYLEKQAKELALHLPEVSWPFTGAYWEGEESPPKKNGWWPWEQRAYWVDGAFRCSVVLGDQKLLDLAGQAIDYTLSHPASDGYLGPEFAHYAKELSPERDNFRWPHNVFFRAVAAAGEVSEDADVAQALRRHFLADGTRVPYGGPSRDVTNIEGMLWAYERTGDKQLLSMAERAWAEFLDSAPPGDHESGDLHPERVFANTPVHAHGVTYIEKAKLPAILYMYTGNAEHLRFAIAAQERIFSHHMLIDGIPSTSEDYADTTSTDSHETCDIVDHMWSWGYLLMATGEGVWADRIERACFNAGIGALKKDWRGLQYFSSPNQFIATQESRNVGLGEIGTGWMSYRPNPGHESACCGGNVHRLLPNYVLRMWMTDPKGGLVSTLYGPGTVQTAVGPDHEPLEILQETHYPFEEEIRFTFRMKKPVTFPLTLRIPRWCEAPQLTLNGEPLIMPTVHKGFVRLERTFHPADRLVLRLPMRTVLSYWLQGGLGIENGPLVYALPVQAEWSSVSTPKWSSDAYPEWSASPVSDWNYGIGVDETQLLEQVRLERGSMTDDPWIDSPVKLTVPLKKIPGWTLHADPKFPERQQTPPLPERDLDLVKALQKEEIEHLSLIPYGATHLRLTIFPS